VSAPCTLPIHFPPTPKLQYLLRIGDTCLILGQRLGEWCGHAPMLEEDIALTNMALDLIGQAAALLTHAGGQWQDYDEDQLAFLRDERDYLNPTLVELPRGDFAFTVLRNAIVATWLKLLWERLRDSSDAELAAIAGKAVKEARYHQQHAADWVVRLGDGTEESHRRCDAALARCCGCTPRAVRGRRRRRRGPGQRPRPGGAELRALAGRDARASWPRPRCAARRHAPSAAPASAACTASTWAYILAEMQHLQRAFPGGAW
jgi:ring-1,2-phenylacetyl-CoA epoxidase subunit PaaC